MHRRPLAAPFLATTLLLALAACSESDKKAPPAPVVDPVETPTSLATVVLTGSAEYGAQVTIRGGLETVRVDADDFTARFRAEVALNTTLAGGATSVASELRVTATDAAGNQSAATVVPIVFEPPHVESLTLTLSQDVVAVEAGEIMATATVGNDQAIDLQAFPVTFTLAGASADVDTLVATPDMNGDARVTFTGLATPATGVTITATVGGASASRSFDLIRESPTVRIAKVNSFDVCPDSGYLTSDLADCATRTSSAGAFRRGSVVLLTLEASDNRSLEEVGYQAFNLDTTRQGSILVAGGSYQPGTTYDAFLYFTVPNAWFGDVELVGYAIDGARYRANSAPAHLDVTLDIVGAAGRQVDVLAAGGYLGGVRDVTVDAAGHLLAVNRDNAAPVVYQLEPATFSASIYADFYPLRPEALALDAQGNLYVSIANDVVTGNNVDQVWQQSAAGAQSAYYTNLQDPEGLATAGATPARGRWVSQGALSDARCVSVQLGAEPDPSVVRADSYIVYLSTGTCPATPTCGGGGALSGLVADACLDSVSSEAQQLAGLVTQLNSVATTTGLSAFESADCDNSGNPCVFLVAATPGTAPGALGAQPLALLSSSGTWQPADVDGGHDAGVLDIVDRNTEEVVEVQVPPAASSALLERYDMTGGGSFGSNSLRAVAPVMRHAAGDASTLAERRWLYVTDDNGGSSRVLAYDVGANTVRRLVNGNGLDTAWGIAYVPSDAAGGGDCLLVASRREVRSYIDIDSATATYDGSIATGFDQLRGITLDTSDPDPARWSLVVVDQNRAMVARIGRSADPADCF